MKKSIYLLVAMLLISVGAIAVPAYPYPIQVTQPDGTVITIQKHGDEWFNYTTTADNYLIEQDKDGWFFYAEYDGEQIKRTSVKVSPVDKRTAEEKELLVRIGRNPITSEVALKLIGKNKKARMAQLPVNRRNLRPNPIFGEKKGLVILVNFKDKSFRSQTANQDFTNLLNEIGYNKNGGTGSARDFFIASTDSQYTPHFDVKGPYTLPQNLAYYGENTGTGNNRGSDKNANKMVEEACSLAFADGVDFSQYDTDNDNEVDMVFIYYAGVNEAEGGPANTIWPHKHELFGNLPTYNGKKIRVYACTSELKGGGSVMCGVGTFCHEYGHVLGLPDYYDTQVSGNFTIGDWDIMCSGNYNNEGRTPPTWASYSRFFLGYLKPELLNTPGEKLLEPIQTSNKAYLLSPSNDTHNLDGDNPNPNWYYMIENRQPLGWDIPSTQSNYSNGGALGKGLLITRINYNATAWSNNTPNNDQNNLRVDIIEADGTRYSYTGDTYPGATNKNVFSPSQSDGSPYDGNLENITQNPDGSVTFCFRDCIESTSLAINPTKTQFFTEVGGTPDRTTFTIIGRLLAGKDTKLSFSTGDANYFKMRKPGQQNWVSTLTLSPNMTSAAGVPNDSLYQVIEVAYDPSIPSYQETHQTVFIAQYATGTPKKSVQLIGSSTPKVTIVPPVMLPFTDTTSNSAIAHWNEVEDATGYYLSVYQKSGSTTEKQSFDSFDTQIDGCWKQNFYTTTNSAIPSMPLAALFTTTRDTLWSAYYPAPVTQLNFWVRNDNPTQNAKFLVDGQTADGKWENIVTLTVDITLDKKNVKQTVDASKDYRWLRFYTQDLEGQVSIDDIEVSFAASMAVDRKFVSGKSTTSTEVNGLSSGTLFYGAVQATDKEEQRNNITNFSNEVELKTLGSSSDDPRALSVSVNADGDIVVSLTKDDMDKDIYVYALDGRLVQSYSKDTYQGSSSIVLKGLPKSTSYIVSVGAERKGKFAKVYASGNKK